MSRSMPTRSRAAETAFDFDVVTDIAPRPSRKPDPVPEAPRVDPVRQPAKTAEA